MPNPVNKSIGSRIRMLCQKKTGLARVLSIQFGSNSIEIRPSDCHENVNLGRSNRVHRPQSNLKGRIGQILTKADYSSKHDLEFTQTSVPTARSSGPVSVKVALHQQWAACP